MSETSLLQRYERAANATPAKFRSRLSGALGDGYWVDDRHYFYSVTGPAAEGVMGALPHVVDASNGVAAPVLSVEAIAALLSGSSGAEVTPAQLAGAQYDMPARGSLIVTLAGNAYHIALDGPTLSHVEVVDPIPSLYAPDGGKACFLKDHAVWIKERATGVAAPLTPEGESLYSFGAEAESAIMPLTVRKVAIPRGLWSRDSAWFVTHRIDERHLPDSGLVENAPAGGKRAVAHVFKVSAPDGELATFELFAFRPANGRFVSSSCR
jgi:dipeptidyl-peptidase-4